MGSWRGALRFGLRGNDAAGRGGERSQVAQKDESFRGLFGHKFEAALLEKQHRSPVALEDLDLEGVVAPEALELGAEAFEKFAAVSPQLKRRGHGEQGEPDHAAFGPVVQQVEKAGDRPVGFVGADGLDLEHPAVVLGRLAPLDEVPDVRQRRKLEAGIELSELIRRVHHGEKQRGFHGVAVADGEAFGAPFVG